MGDEKGELEAEKDSPSLAADHPARPASTRSATGAAAMSESRREETRASEQNAEEGCLSSPKFVAGHLEDLEDALLCSEPPPIHRIQDWKGQGQEWRMPPSGWHLHRMRRLRRHSCPLCEDPRQLGGQREWETRSEGRDQRAVFPGSELEDGVAAAASGDEASRGAEGLSEGGVVPPPANPRFVPGEMEDLEDALRIPEHPADCLLCQRGRCCWTARVEKEVWPIFMNSPDLGPCKWSW